MLFFPWTKKYTCIKDISAHSVTESVTTATSYCHVTLARAATRRGEKRSEFSLDLSEMRPVHVLTRALLRLERTMNSLCHYETASFTYTWGSSLSHIGTAEYRMLIRTAFPNRTTFLLTEDTSSFIVK